MAIFTFDKVDDYVQNNNKTNQINFLKLPNDKDMAKVRFLYGPGETFTGYSVHNVSKISNRPKYVPCLREPGQPLDLCPLCKAGNRVGVQYYIPVYVISITTHINGTANEQPINNVYIFQRGKTFSNMLGSIVRQCGGTPIVSNVFNLVRNGKQGETDTMYTVEFLSRDNKTLEDIQFPVPQVFGTFILPNLTAQQMTEKYLNVQEDTQQVTPRTVQVNPVQQNISGGFNMNAQASQSYQPPKMPF